MGAVGFPTTPTDGQTFEEWTFDATKGLWELTPVSSSGGGATTLDGLTDVSTSGVTPKQTIAYNGSSWAVDSYAQSINDLTDGVSDTTTFVGLGTGALANNTGADNTAVGINALNANTTGSCNTASGQNALFANTTGECNTASGVQALLSNTTGISNTASGNCALRSNTEGCCNTASGMIALYFNTTGS